MILCPVPGSVTAVFVRRRNRFAGEVMLPSGVETAHVPDPGRLKELLFPGNRVLVIPRREPVGRTSCTLLAAQSRGAWILTNTAFHPRIAAGIIRHGLLGQSSRIVRREPVLPGFRSRFDFLLEDGLILEVKGCTLARGKLALFPDAPTSRGTRQVMELTRHVENGGAGMVLFLVTVPWAEAVAVNRETDPAFGDSMDSALDAGVSVRAAVVSLENDGVVFRGMIPFHRRVDYRYPSTLPEGV
jgi:sugar fermentation stimulation protein A